WGLYAERLAAESDWYKDDPIGLLGQLDSELYRARRLVVDTGIHAKHWTRQQAIDYGIEASEVERYVVIPGQACSYMIGTTRILEGQVPPGDTSWYHVHTEPVLYLTLSASAQRTQVLGEDWGRGRGEGAAPAGPAPAGRGTAPGGRGAPPIPAGAVTTIR